MLPNFLVIGAPRSGTTSLYEYLRAHPDIYMSPVKEPDFFAHAPDALARTTKPSSTVPGASRVAGRRRRSTSATPTRPAISVG